MTNITEDPKVQFWLSQFTAENTTKSYRLTLEAFCKFTKKTPKQLIETRQIEIKEATLAADCTTYQLIMNFRKTQLKSGVAEGTVVTREGAIRSFFGLVTGVKMKLKGLKSNKPARETFIPTLDEFKQILLASTPENQFRFLFLAHFGGRPDDALDVTYGQIRRELEKGVDPTEIRDYYPSKNTVGQRIIFIGTDCINTFKIAQQRLNIFDDSDKLMKTRTSASIELKQLNKAWQKACKNAQIDTGNYHVRIYGLRKFFRTQLGLGTFKDRELSWMMGHEEKIDDRYNRKKIETLRIKYKESQKFINPLTTGSTLDVEDKTDTNLHMQGLVNVLLEIVAKTSDPAKFDKVKTEILNVKPEIKYDSERDLKPIIYLIQAGFENLEKEVENE